MRRLLLAAVCLSSAVGCRIEDHTPQGSRLDEGAVTAIVTEYARALSARDWPGVRSLFWRDGAYSGPMVPRSVGHTIPIDTALQRFAFALDGAEPRVVRRPGPAHRLPAGRRPRVGLAHAPPAHAARRRRSGGAGLGRAPGASTDRGQLANPERGRVRGSARKSARPALRASRLTGPLAVVGAVARLLNTSVGAEETLAQVAESLRRGLSADR